jgi:hypothetical protein
MWDSIPEGYVPELNVVYFPQLGNSKKPEGLAHT